MDGERSANHGTRPHSVVVRGEILRTPSLPLSLLSAHLARARRPREDIIHMFSALPTGCLLQTHDVPHRLNTNPDVDNFPYFFTDVLIRRVMYTLYVYRSGSLFQGLGLQISPPPPPQLRLRVSDTNFLEVGFLCLVAMEVL
jgi:hypothetical protein